MKYKVFALVKVTTVYQDAPAVIAAFNVVGKNLHNLLRLLGRTIKSDTSPRASQPWIVQQFPYRLSLLRLPL